MNYIEGQKFCDKCGSSVELAYYDYGANAYFCGNCHTELWNYNETEMMYRRRFYLHSNKYP